jgi:hypothetical protein
VINKAVMINKALTTTLQQDCDKAVEIRQPNQVTTAGKRKRGSSPAATLVIAADKRDERTRRESPPHYN